MGGEGPGSDPDVYALLYKNVFGAKVKLVSGYSGTNGATLALVGHEPNLSTFLCWLLTGLHESFIELKKGGAALVEVTHPAAAGRGKLQWILKPSQLRGLR